VLKDYLFILIPVAKTALIVNVLLLSVAAMTWVERRLSAIIQFRLGPNRVGYFGVLQPFADGLKFILKQDVIPRDAHKAIFVFAPFLAMVTSLCAFAVVPVGSSIEIAGEVIDLVLIDLDGGILFSLAAASLGVYGIVCAGWASGSKFSLIGGLRASAQMISYELALGLSVVGVVLVAGSLRPTTIVELQAGWFWNWNVFAGGWQLLGFAIFVISAFAETNRLPFDLPEAESELVAGYHTEYSSMKFAMFFMAEYVAMITASSLIVTLYLGGYNPGFPVSLTGLPLVLLQVGTFAAKVGFFLIVFVWVRWTLPRFRYDQLMNLGWKRLFPLALVNIVITALLITFGVI